MYTKIVAARLATSAGVTTIIARASNPGNIRSIVKYLEKPSLAAQTDGATGSGSGSGSSGDGSSGEDPSREAAETPPLHTRFLPSTDPIRDRTFWILHGLKPHGTVYIDQGAYRALLDKAGLLPVGIVHVEGSFAQQEAVRLVVVNRRLSKPDAEGRLWEGPATEVGRALVNYSAFEISKIKGHQSAEIGDLLGYADSAYVAQREHVCFFTRESRPVSPVHDTDGITRGIGGYEVAS